MPVFSPHTATLLAAIVLAAAPGTLGAQGQGPPWPPALRPWIAMGAGPGLEIRSCDRCAPNGQPGYTGPAVGGLALNATLGLTFTPRFALGATAATFSNLHDIEAPGRGTTFFMATAQYLPVHYDWMSVRGRIGEAQSLDETLGVKSSGLAVGAGVSLRAPAHGRFASNLSLDYFQALGGKDHELPWRQGLGRYRAGVIALSVGFELWLPRRGP